MAQTVAQNILETTAKRLLTLEKSLAKKKRALQVQEELEKPPTSVDLESNKTYIYYSKELERVEEEFARKRELLDAQEERDKIALENRKREMLQKLDEERALRRARYEKEVSKAYNESESKSKYFRDAIDALKEKLMSPQPTGKVYRRLKAEVEMEQREYDALKEEHDAGLRSYNEVIVPKELEVLRKRAQAEAEAQKRKEELELQEKREAAIAARKAKEAADEARQLAALEEEQKAASSVVETPSRAPEKIQKTPPKDTPEVVEGGSRKSSNTLERIRIATTAKTLEDIANAEKFNDEEEALWNERYDLLVAKEESQRNYKEETNSIVSEVSEAPVIREQLIADAIRATLANDMAEQDRIIDTLTTQEMREYNKRISAHYAAQAKPKVPALGSFQPVSVTAPHGFPPTLKTTKKLIVRRP